MVLWNVTLFSVLVAASCLEILLCGIQLVNATIGVICGDCRKKVGQLKVELWRDRLAHGSILTHFLFSTGLSSMRLNWQRGYIYLLAPGPLPGPLLDHSLAPWNKLF